MTSSYKIRIANFNSNIKNYRVVSQKAQAKPWNSAHKQHGLSDNTHMQIDHIFVRATANAPEAELLRTFGLTEGSGNIHPGQGTQNRRFFFHNAFIELLWIADIAEVTSAATAPTMLHQRLSEPHASPFGVCFRPCPGQTEASFPVWPYTPAYLPAGMSIGIARDADLAEPMWFYFEQAQPPEAAPTERSQPLDHACGAWRITAITITTPTEKPWSSAALAAARTEGMTMLKGENHLMEVTFDQGACGRQHDFRPALPLVFHY
ncbi:MAG: VOC family protein [Duganella sp.]